MTRKYLLILFVILVFNNVGKAQNWLPINAVDTYHYAIDTVNFPSHTIWVDSVKTFAGRTEYYFNRIVAPCDTCDYLKKKYKLENPEYPENRIHLLNQPQFLNLKMISYRNGWMKFIGKDTFWINAHAKLNESWLFDSSNMVLAKLISENVRSIFGTVDSTKTILLSYKDTVIVSKSFGIIKFPELKSHNYHYNLIGVETQKLGYTMPGVLDYYDFEIGDRFQYKGGSGDPWVYENYIKNYVITGKSLTKDSLIYDYTGFKIGTRMHKVNPYYNDTFEYNGQIRLAINRLFQEVTYYLDSKLYNNQDFRYFGFGHIIMRFGSDMQNNLIQNAYGFKTNDGTWDYAVDSQDNNVLLPIQSLPEANSFEIRIGLGIVDYHHYIFEISESYSLTGYIKNGDTVGTIIPYNVLSVKNAKGHSQYNIYPNPSTDRLHISLSKVNATGGEFIIYNLHGQEMLSGQCKEDITEIDIQTFIDGIYILQFNLGNQIFTERFVKY